MAAEQPPDGSGRRQRRGWWIAAGVLALLLVIGLVVLWIKVPALYGRGDAAKTAAATTRGAILTVAAALIAATAAGAGLYMTARTLAETQRANREADQRDRYAKAIEQLGSDKLDIRLGGIYGLERIAKTSEAETSERERDQHTVVEVLSAYVRQHTDPTQRRRRPPPAAAQGQTPPQPATDVQAVLTVLGRLPSQDGVPRGDLTGARLSGADLIKADLFNARLAGVDLSGAWLVKANLSNAWLDGANLSGAWLAGVDLSGAILAGANLSGAWLIRANLSGPRVLTRNMFARADLARFVTRARLVGADLSGAVFGGADLSNARLFGANLAAARNLTQRQLDSARGDDRTTLPVGRHRPTHWSAAGGTATGSAY